MLPIFHIILGLILVVIFYFFGLNFLYAILFFLACFCFDIDHYIYYIFKKRSFNLRKAYKYFRFDLNKNLKKGQKKIEFLFIFHTIEFICLLFLLSFVSPIFLWIFLGWIFHMLIDWTYGLISKDNKKYKRAFSLIYYVWKNKKRAKNLKK